MSLSTIVRAISNALGRHKSQQKRRRVMPSERPPMFEVVPVRLGNTDYFFYHVRNMRTGEIVRRTGNFALAEIIAHQANVDAEAEATVIRTEVNHLSIHRFLKKEAA